MMFPISTLDIEGEPVWLTVGNVELQGALRILVSGRRVYRVRVGGRQTVDLPAHTEPTAWRPVDLAAWPVPLPDGSASGSTAALAADDEADTPERVADHDWWAAPLIRLGNPKELPETIEEAEARLLRALRTRDYIEHHTRGDMHAGSAWPQPLMVAADSVRRLLEASRTGELAWFRREDYDDVYVDTSRLEARRVLWHPTRRDIGDLEDGVLGHLDGNARIWNMRSANPPYSWRQIADVIRRHRSGVKPMYLRSREHAFRSWLSA